MGPQTYSTVEGELAFRKFKSNSSKDLIQVGITVRCDGGRAKRRSEVGVTATVGTPIAAQIG
jgi:hypothetical protein